LLPDRVGAFGKGRFRERVGTGPEFGVEFFLLVPGNINAQDKVIGPSIIITGEYLGESPPLRDLPTITDAEWQQMVEKAEQEDHYDEMENGIFHGDAGLKDVMAINELIKNQGQR